MGNINKGAQQTKVFLENLLLDNRFGLPWIVPNCGDKQKGSTVCSNVTTKHYTCLRLEALLASGVAWQAIDACTHSSA